MLDEVSEGGEFGLDAEEYLGGALFDIGLSCPLFEFGGDGVDAGDMQVVPDIFYPVDSVDIGLGVVAVTVRVFSWTEGVELLLPIA